MTTMTQIGTLAWSRRTGGQLSRQEREALLKDIVARRARALQPEQWSGIDVTAKGLARMDIDRIRIPDSRTARQAEALVAALSPPFLTQHCHRTYLWGSLLAQHDALHVDEELFYVASLLHDLGLTERYFGRHPQLHCFAVEGAMAADAFLLQEGWEQRRRDSVAEAITLHLNPTLSWDLPHDPVAHYMHAGARCDVEGERASDLPNSAIHEVLHRHPGLEFATGFAQLLTQEAQLRPEGRIGFYRAHFGLGELFPLGKQTEAV